MKNKNILNLEEKKALKKLKELSKKIHFHNKLRFEMFVAGKCIWEPGRKNNKVNILFFERKHEWVKIGPYKWMDKLTYINLKSNIFREFPGE